jgi:Domain of unknown function (DUF4760)
MCSNTELYTRLNLMNSKQSKFKFPIKATLLSILLALIVSGTYASVQDSKTRESIAFTVTTLTAALGGIAAFYALQELKQSLETRDLEEEARKIERTMALIGNWDEDQFAKARITIGELFQTMSGNANRGDELCARLNRDVTAKQDVTLILNLLEKVAIFCQTGLLNEPLLRNFYRPIILQCWEAFKIYVMDRRTEVNSDIYEGLEALYRDWSKNP